MGDGGSTFFLCLTITINRTYRAKSALFTYMTNKKHTYSTLKELYEKELSVREVSQVDIEFVLSLIRESRLDENQCIMDNDYWERLKERNLLDVFEEINKAYSIVWSHSIEPEV